MNSYEKDPGWEFLRFPTNKLLKEQSRAYDIKKNVWVPDPEEGYVAAEITLTKGDNVVLKVKDSERTLKKELIQEMNPPKYEKTEDMSNLTFLNDASVLYNLRSRYAAMLIYTYSGLFCVVINPYKRLPIYTKSVAHMYMGKRRTEMPPHLFAVSDEAYRNMLQDHENQSMLITGESGAGKTENTKKVISYFASVGANQQEQGEIKTFSKTTLEDQIVQTNPVLEAFGNAKTVRNNNSSRFGKFIRIHFNKAGRVASCDIEHYLLEKSRVIRQATGERCYHIFYQIFSGYIPDLRSKLKLNKNLTDYVYVAQAELVIDGIDDKEEFKLTDEAFDVLNFSAREKFECYRLISGIMHMGNMKFKQRPREDQAEPDETEEANYSAQMFGINTDALLNALVKPRVRVGNEWISKGQNVEQVAWALGAMAKALYARVFDWLVKKCNMTLDQKGLSRDSFIGVLDIAGFEIFDFNSFEQLWINFVNEKLQQYFNHHMFVLEQEEYAREGIQWTFIDFGLDLQACIELIEKPMGIISMLDEECIVPKATDATLRQKLVEQHLGKHPNFEKPKPPKGKQAEAHFAMRHYAGTVRYNVTNWLEKNKDPLNDTLVSVMKNAKDQDLLLEVWANYQTQEEAALSSKSGGAVKKKKKSGSFMTVSMLYRESLNNLMNMLNKTHPHFIRCIIPNEKKTSGIIDSSLVLNQLTCNGVLEGIRICRKGFPNRTNHREFQIRFSLLAATEARESKDPKTAATNILNKLCDINELSPIQFCIGHTKIFFKAGVLALIEELRDARVNILMTAFQAYLRAYLARMGLARKYAYLDSYYFLQKNIRTWTILRTWNWYILYNKIKTMFKGNRHSEEIKRIEKELKEIEEKYVEEEESRKQLQEAYQKLQEERNKLNEELQNLKSDGKNIEQEVSAVSVENTKQEHKLSDLQDCLSDQKQRIEETQRQLRRAEKDRQTFNEQIFGLDTALERLEAEKKESEARIDEMNAALTAQNESIANLSREKKRADEENRKLAENLQMETEKRTQTNRAKIKLESALEDVEDSVEREHRHRLEIEKTRKKLEAELLSTQERIEESANLKAEIEAKHHRVEEDLQSLMVHLEDQISETGKTQRELKDQTTRIQELEEELEQVCHSRVKTDKARIIIQNQLDDLQDAIEIESGKTSAQIEITKKKDVELIRLKHDLESLNQRNENQLGVVRKKNLDEMTELSARIETIQNSKNKMDKEKENIRRQLDDVQTEIMEETKNKSEKERILKNIEQQINDFQNKFNEQNKLIQDLVAQKIRIQMETSDSEQQLEELEARLTQLSKSKAQALAQLESAKRTTDEEHQERMEMAGIVKKLQYEIEQFCESINEETQQKEEIFKQLSRIKSEVQQWKAKLEGDGLIDANEIEEERRKRHNQKLQIQDTLNEVLMKIQQTEKSNSKLLNETEDVKADMEQNRLQIEQLEKKQIALDKTIEDLHRQCDRLTSEIEKIQGEICRNNAEIYTIQNASTSLNEQSDDLQRENKILGNELRDLGKQITTISRYSHDAAKKVRMLEQEKEELQRQLEEAESMLEVEENKVLKIQNEVGQIRVEIDRRINEKAEEFENSLRNYQRSMDSLKATLDNEAKGKNALLTQKKKIETDINDMELAMDMANKTNLDAQKNIKKLIVQTQELQLQVDDEQRQRDEAREKYLTAEKQVANIFVEKREMELQREQLEHNKQHREIDLTDQRAQKQELQSENMQITTARRTVENEMEITKKELNKTMTELKQSEENYKRVSSDMGRLDEELRQEQQHRDYLDRVRKGNEAQLKELQARFEDTEIQVQRIGQRAVDKLQQCIRAREQEFDAEQKHHKDVAKQLSKCERELRERRFELEEHKNNTQKIQDLIEKLQSKIKVQKKQLEEAEEVATMNIQKYRQIQSALEHAEERADEAENSLIRAKSKSRANGLGISASSAAVVDGLTRNGSRHFYGKQSN